MSSNNPICAHCKPDNPEHHEALIIETGCDNYYELVESCMKAHNGRISDCKEEWKNFRECFAKSKGGKSSRGK